MKVFQVGNKDDREYIRANLIYVARAARPGCVRSLLRHVLQAARLQILLRYEIRYISYASFSPVDLHGVVKVNGVVMRENPLTNSSSVRVLNAHVMQT